MQNKEDTQFYWQQTQMHTVFYGAKKQIERSRDRRLHKHGKFNYSQYRQEVHIRMCNRQIHNRCHNEPQLETKAKQLESMQKI